jgi:hypothetical protein
MKQGTGKIGGGLLKLVLVLFLSSCISLGENEVPQPLTPQQAWALALSGVMTEVNDDWHDALSFNKMNRTHKRRYKQILRESWNIHNRYELLMTLEATEYDGHAQSLAAVKKEIGENPDALTAGRFGGFRSGGRYLRYVAANWNIYRDRTILAWDWGRCVSLCRWGYGSGYLSEEEAWEKIMYYARKIQPLYTSWEDYGFDYFMGRVFWASGFGEEKEYFEVTKVIYDDLTSYGGYWKSLEWDISLR